MILGILAGIGAANTQWVWDSTVVRGQPVTIHATFVTQSERIAERTVQVKSNELLPESLLEPTKVTIERTERDLLEPVPTVEVGELTEHKPTELQHSEKVRTADVEQIVAAEEPAVHQQRELALPSATADVTAAMPSVAGAAVDELPRQRASNRPPSYPTEAWRDNKQHGRVMIRALIADDGHVAKALIETSCGAAILDDAALAAVLEWHFTPARRGGIAVEYEILIPVRFKL